MGCGKPVIASPVGMNAKIVENNLNGFLADTPNEWYHYLEILYLDKDIREKMGIRNREKIMLNYSLQATGNIYYNLVKSISA
jgi:glycosyltransferase involved in cell wall biosynthesis